MEPDDVAACEHCLYASPLVGMGQQPTGRFICRHRPPTVVPGDHAPRTVWPIVDPSDWCREFYPRSHAE